MHPNLTFIIGTELSLKFPTKHTQTRHGPTGPKAIRKKYDDINTTTMYTSIHVSKQIRAKVTKVNGRSKRSPQRRRRNRPSYRHRGSLTALAMDFLPQRTARFSHHERRLPTAPSTNSPTSLNSTRDNTVPRLI